MTIYKGSKDDDRISKSPQVIKQRSPTFAQTILVRNKPVLETAGTMSIQQQFQCVSDDEDEVSLKDQLLHDTDEHRVLLTSIFKKRLADGRGETLFEIGYDEEGSAMKLSEDELSVAFNTLVQVGAGLQADCSLIHKKIHLAGGWTGIVMMRKRSDATEALELRVACVGNVDAGKSTLLGVLTKGGLDDGRGKARVNLFRHQHEKESGRTSSVGMEILGYSSLSTPILGSQTTGRKLTWEEISEKSSKIISFIDLAGHERYLRTTVFGLTGCAPDYVMLMVGGNAGLIGMSKEHLGIAVSLGVPVMVIITKIDMTPKNVLEETEKQLLKILKGGGCRKTPMFIDSLDAVVVASGKFTRSNICPIFRVSNVTGEGIDLVRTFLNILPFHGQYSVDKPAEFLINDTFSVPYTGAVVAGVVNSGTIHNGDTMWMGPNNTDDFIPVTIRNIQRKRVNVPIATAGQSASFALKKVRRQDIRKGMVMLQKTDLPPRAVREFVAEVMILYHQTTIKPKYQAMLHVNATAQTCQIVSIDHIHRKSKSNADAPDEAGAQILRTGDRGLVRFRFMQRAEYLKEGTKLIFREGRTKGLGTVKEVFPVKESAIGSSISSVPESAGRSHTRSSTKDGSVKAPVHTGRFSKIHNAPPGDGDKTMK